MGSRTSPLTVCLFAPPQGNKGGVAARLSVYGHLLCFLNCHLPAHLNNSGQRITSFQRILAVLQFTSEKAPAVLDHE